MFCSSIEEYKFWLNVFDYVVLILPNKRFICEERTNLTLDDAWAHT
jgi:hypothetical protein